MWELILASLLPTLTMILSILYLRRYIPALMQQALNDVGEHITKTFADPNVKRAFSIMGKKSGESRASASLRNKVAGKVIESSPILGRVLEEFDISPVEGLEILNDPLLQPIIAKFIQTNLPTGLSTNPTNPSQIGEVT